MDIHNFIENPFGASMTFIFRRMPKLESSRHFVIRQYKMATGKNINLRDPQSFNEKLQWLKLYDHHPKYIQMVDKIAAKQYVESILGSQYIIPTLGIWDDAKQIDFSMLPKQFVLKCNHDSGSVVVCRDKQRLDKEKTIVLLNKRLSKNYYYQSREWPYKGIVPKVFAEQFMENEDKSNSGLTDYKFYCFGGNPKMLYVSQGLENHETARISFLDLNWQFAPFSRSDYAPFEQLPPKPKTFDEMLKIAGKLSQDIPFLRVDLYEIKGKVYFSELTFCPCNGMMPFDPPEYDKILGDWIKLP